MKKWKSWGLSVLVIFLLLFLPGCSQAGNSNSGGSSGQSANNAVVEGEIPLPPAAKSLKGGTAAQPPAKFQLKSAVAVDQAKEKRTLRWEESQTKSASTRIVSVVKDDEDYRYTVVEYSLASGWNTISFPFDSLTSITGLNYYLYYWDGSRYQIVDPANADKIDCRKGYWAYSDEVATFSVKGDYPGSYLNPVFHQGWNLFAFPKDQSLAKSSITYNEESKTISDAISAGWIGKRIIYYQDGIWRFLYCNESSSLHSGPGYWLWSQVEGAVFNPAPPDSAADQVIQAAVTALEQNNEDAFVQLCITDKQTIARQFFARLRTDNLLNTQAQALEKATVIYDEVYERRYYYFMPKTPLTSPFHGEPAGSILILEKESEGNWKIVNM